MNKLKVNDQVIVIAGRDKGKSGKITKINLKRGKVLVEGVNIVKKTIKSTQENPNGGISSKEVFIDRSNVMLMSPKTNKRTRVKIENKDGKNLRIAKTCGTELS